MAELDEEARARAIAEFNANVAHSMAQITSAFAERAGLDETQFKVEHRDDLAPRLPHIVITLYQNLERGESSLFETVYHATVRSSTDDVGVTTTTIGMPVADAMQFVDNTLNPEFIAPVEVVVPTVDGGAAPGAPGVGDSPDHVADGALPSPTAEEIAAGAQAMRDMVSTIDQLIDGKGDNDKEALQTLLGQVKAAGLTVTPEMEAAISGMADNAFLTTAASVEGVNGAYTQIQSLLASGTEYVIEGEVVREVDPAAVTALGKTLLDGLQPGSIVVDREGIVDDVPAPDASLRAAIDTNARGVKDQLGI